MSATPAADDTGHSSKSKIHSHNEKELRWGGWERVGKAGVGSGVQTHHNDAACGGCRSHCHGVCEFLDKCVHLLHVSLHMADHAETTRVMDASDMSIYVSSASINMADCAFKTTQVTDVNITQVTDVNITQVTDVNITQVTDVNVTQVSDESDKHLYVSPLSVHMADYAFRTTQVTDVNITQVTDVNITQVIDVSDRHLYVSPLSVHMPHD